MTEGDVRSTVPSSSSTESLEVEKHPPKAQVVDKSSHHQHRMSTSHPQVEEHHRFMSYRTQPHTTYPPSAANPFHTAERRDSSVPPVTPSPSSPTQTPYRFETPAYVFASSHSNVLEQLKSSAGCTCKKSRYVFLFSVTFIGLVVVTHLISRKQMPQTLLSMFRVLHDLRSQMPLRRLSQLHRPCREHRQCATGCAPAQSRGL